MEEKIENFLKELKENLSGLPADEIKRALTFYEEYISDALEAGNSAEEIRGRLKAPSEIAGDIAASLKFNRSLDRIEESPGLRNLAVAMRNVSRVLTTPLAAFVLVIFELVPVTLMLSFLICCLASGISAVAVFTALLYEAVRVPSGAVLSLIGTLAASIFFSGLLVLLTYGFYVLARLCIRLTARVARRFMRRSGTHPSGYEGNTESREYKPRRFGIIVTGITVLAFIVLFLSGLPVTYFRIFNSEKIETSIQAINLSSETAGLRGIRIITMNSMVRIAYGSSKTIGIRYEETPWLSYTLGSEDGILTFREVSTGRLPLYLLASLHESLTEVTVSLPAEYEPDTVVIETTGGHVRADGIRKGLKITTLNGNINVTLPEDSGLSAFSKNGSIFVAGNETGLKTPKGIELRYDGKGETQLATTNGSISVD